jgi:putative transposase
MTDRILDLYRSQIPVKHLAFLICAVRGSYYRRRAKVVRPQAHSPRDERTLAALLHRICAQETGYGYRRVTLELHNRGHKINRKHVLRLMRQEKLLWRVRKRFKAATTDSRHRLRIYPNLLESLVVRHPNHVWVADITYIDCGKDTFGYLAVVLDVYTRMCVGWSLQPYLDTRLTLEALQQALARRVPPRVHHSDRGRQYASEEYTKVLKAHQIRISMSRAGNPYDNAIAESFFKTLKTEEVNLQEYASIEEARRSIDEYIRIRYNQRRLHSSLGYQSPRAFETAYHQRRIFTLKTKKRVSP